MGLLRCGYKACKRAEEDCKNSRYVLEKEDVNEDLCRPLRANCSQIRFCCQAHLERCRFQEKPKTGPRGPREAISPEQVGVLYNMLLAMDTTWPAVLMLVQLFLGDRANCARQARRSWFKNLAPEDGGLPMVEIPAWVTKTKKGRSMPLHEGFARRLYKWMHVQPLRPAVGHSQWPWPGQEMVCSAQNDPVLFPGCRPGGDNERLWDTPISTRAYFMWVSKAVDELRKQRAWARREGLEHAFVDVDLQLVSTHSMKKSGVTILADSGATWAVVSSLTGTTTKVLATNYDCPSTKRQRRALTALTPVMTSLDPQSSSSDASSSSSQPPPMEPATATTGQREDKAEEEQLPMLQFCPFCGSKCMDQAWKYCPACGNVYPMLGQGFR